MTSPSYIQGAAAAVTRRRDPQRLISRRRARESYYDAVYRARGILGFADNGARIAGMPERARPRVISLFPRKLI